MVRDRWGVAILSKIENTLSRAIERWLYLFAEQPKRDKTAWPYTFFWVWSCCSFLRSILVYLSFALIKHLTMLILCQLDNSNQWDPTGQVSQHLHFIRAAILKLTVYRSKTASQAKNRQQCLQDSSNIADPGNYQCQYWPESEQICGNILSNHI